MWRRNLSKLLGKHHKNDIIITKHNLTTYLCRKSNFLALKTLFGLLHTFKNTRFQELLLATNSIKFLYKCLYYYLLHCSGEEAVEKAPLVIPLKPNTLITMERLKEIAEKVEKSIEEPEPDEKTVKMEVKEEPQENETLDQMAIRELLEEAKKEVKVEQSELTVPIPAKPVMEGETEVG